MANESNLPEAGKSSGAVVEPVVDPGTAYQPAVDIVENMDSMVLYIDLPGVAAGGTQIEADENNILTLKARNSFREPDGVMVQQAALGDYFRAFQLGSEYDRGRISATLKDGVLTVHIPKREESKTRRIEIRT